MSILASVKQILRICGHALTRSVHDRLDGIESSLTSLLQASIHIVENMHALGGRVVVNAAGAGATPETALYEFLYSHLPSRAAVEINGSNEDVTKALALAGYNVYAIQSGRNSAAAMAAQVNGSTASTSVAVQEAIPVSIGLATLYGDPVAALRELKDREAAVISADLSSGLAALVTVMRGRQYHWHLVLYRMRDASPTLAGPSYLANYASDFPEARGSVLFFRDYKTFAEAQGWCSAILPRTYVKPFV